MRTGAFFWGVIPILVIVAAHGFGSTGSIEWYPDPSEDRVILVIKQGWFAEAKYLPLYWRFTRAYDADGEMAWCAWIGNKWEKVYPFGEDLTGVQYRKEWLYDSPYKGSGPPR